MKIWMHIMAGLVGFALAALIVYIVFGSASEQGATQDGAAPASITAASGQLCGSITPAQIFTPAARKTAGENPPPTYDQAGLVPSVADPQQRAWFARVQAASGMCIDQIRVVPDTGTTIEMTTIESVTVPAASAYVGGVVTQAFTQPLRPNLLTVNSMVGSSKRSIVISIRAWNAFRAHRGAAGPVTASEIAAFSKASSYAATDLRVTGW